MPEDREKALSFGMDDYLSKPVKPEELEAVLLRWISEQKAEAAIPEGTVHDSTTSDGTVGPLDPDVLQSIRQVQEHGEPDLLTELANLFLEDAPQQLEVLRKALDDGDASSVKRVAHTLKGSCGNMGAKRMAAVCAELQDIARSGDLARAPVLVEYLQAEFARVRQALEAEVRN
jgi:HPt (histidine-containing phosphotransfer) domain-containing protein